MAQPGRASTQLEPRRLVGFAKVLAYKPSNLLRNLTVRNAPYAAAACGVGLSPR